MLEIAALVFVFTAPLAWVFANKARYESPHRLSELEAKMEETLKTITAHERVISEGRIKDLQAEVQNIKLGNNLAGTGRHF